MPLVLAALVVLAGPLAWLEGLADPSWHVRERASTAMVASGWRAQPALWLGRASDDAEVRSRCRRVEAAQAAIRWETAGPMLAKAFAPTDYPFLDGLWYDTERREYDRSSAWRSACQEYIDAALANGKPEFLALPCGPFRQATSAWVRDGVAAGVPAWCYRVLFVEMRRRDQVYLESQTAGQKLPAGQP